MSSLNHTHTVTQLSSVSVCVWKTGAGVHTKGQAKVKTKNMHHSHSQSKALSQFYYESVASLLVCMFVCVFSHRECSGVQPLVRAL